VGYATGKVTAAFIKNLAIFSSFNQLFYDLFHVHLLYQQTFVRNILTKLICSALIYERYFRFPLIKNEVYLFLSYAKDVKRGCMI
jgi:hypothetical protein